MDEESQKQGKKLRGKLERASLNFPIQGCAGSMTKLATIYIRAYISKHKAWDKFQLTNLIHDEIVVEAREEFAETAKKVVERSMKAAADIWCKTIPMGASGSIGDYWAH